jgi:hypothetical protein
LESHLKEVHKTHIRKQEKVGDAGKKGESKKPKASVVAFPWKWVGVGAIALIIVFSVIMIRPLLPGGGSTNPNVPEECIEGKTLTIDFVVSLHIFITDASTHRDNYTQLIPHGIGTDPIGGQSCTRRMHTGYDYNSSSEATRIHVESPEEKTYTLGDFFLIWYNQTLGPGKVLSFWYESGWRIIFKVNGAVVADTSTNLGYHYETFVLSADQNIIFYISK